MGYDYESTDGGGSGNTPTKECTECEGIGRVFQNGDPDEQDPDGEECTICKGTGWVDVSDEEQADFHQGRIDDEAEHANDIYNSKN